MTYLCIYVFIHLSIGIGQIISTQTRQKSSRWWWFRIKESSPQQNALEGEFYLGPAQTL